MGTKVAVAFANIFMVKVEGGLTVSTLVKTIKQKRKKPVWWKRYIDQTTSSLCGISEENN